MDSQMIFEMKKAWFIYYKILSFFLLVVGTPLLFIFCIIFFGETFILSSFFLFIIAFSYGCIRLIKFKRPQITIGDNGLQSAVLSKQIKADFVVWEDIHPPILSKLKYKGEAFTYFKFAVRNHALNKYNFTFFHNLFFKNNIYFSIAHFSVDAQVLKQIIDEKIHNKHLKQDC